MEEVWHQLHECQPDLQRSVESGLQLPRDQSFISERRRETERVREREGETEEDQTKHCQ